MDLPAGTYLCNHSLKNSSSGRCSMTGFSLQRRTTSRSCATLFGSMFLPVLDAILDYSTKEPTRARMRSSPKLAMNFEPHAAVIKFFSSTHFRKINNTVFSVVLSILLSMHVALNNNIVQNTFN